MRKTKKTRRVNLNLNLILWFTFLLFAILLIALFTLVQNYQMNKQYREQIKSNLVKAGRTISTSLLDSAYPFKDINRIMFSAANQYGVSAYLFMDEEGDGNEAILLYPDLPNEEQSEEFKAVIERVKEEYEKEQATVGGTEAAGWLLYSDDFAGYACRIELGGRVHFIYCSSSFELINSMSRDMAWYSLITALFAVALSFVVSGFVSMLITKPVTAVTERARQLARGNYDFGESGSYFCTEVNDLSKALDYAGKEISKTDKMQKELIANVSHDFKTPLTMIKAYAAMIREISGDDPEKRAKHTQIIIDETDRLAALVEDVLDLSRLQTDADNVERTVFNLTEDVYSVVGRFGYLSETQGYVFETDIDEDLYTYAGKARVEQVLYNLIGNAVNYTGEDKKVVVRLKKREREARFEVIDSGRGIPPEEIDTIWERYYRSSEMHKRPVKGTGLGLSIVKEVLKKYNIPFGVTSEQGKGSCFWVDFPAPPDGQN